MSTIRTPSGTTLTDDELRRGPYVGANAPTVLWVPALGIEVELPMIPRLTIGRIGVDVELPHTSVSRHHCNVERYGSVLKFVDTGSKNGLSVRDPAQPEAALVDSAVISPGDTALRIGRLYVVALTKPMIEALRVLRFLLGYGDGSLVPLVTEVARGRHCVVLGPDDRGREHVAAALVHASTRTASHPVLSPSLPTPAGDAAVRAWVSAAEGGTVYLDGRALARMTDDDRSLLVELIASDVRGITAVAICDDVDSARHLLGSLFTRMQFTIVTPVRVRCQAGELRPMIDHLFAEAGSAHRVDLIGRDVLLQPSFVERYSWPFEFNELRAYVTCLRAELDGVSVRKLAEMKGIDRSSLARLIERWQSGDEGKRPKDDVIRALLGGGGSTV